MGITGADAPKSGRKNDNGQEEENARDFEPQDSADAAKWGQEAPRAFGHPATGGADRLSGMSLAFNHLGMHG